MSNPAQGVSHDVCEVFSKKLTNTSGVTHRRRIPTPLVLSASSNSSMVDTTINDGKLLLRQRSIVCQSQSNSAHHVKMGIHHSCPRTPLRSAGSGAGLTPRVNRWQDSETEYDSSIQSLTGTECTQNTVTGELHPSLFLPSHKPLNLDLSLDHIWPSPTSTVQTTTSEESSTSESFSIYSNDSAHSEDPPQLPGAFLCASVSLRRPSLGKSISSPDTFLAEPFTPPSATGEGDNSQDFQSPRAVQVIKTRPLDVKGKVGSIKTKPRVHSTITPSPMKESTKTIQVRRSFGQLLLFRRPSQIQVSLTGQASAFSNGNKTSLEDEEKEELQTGVGNNHSPISTQSFRTSSGGSRSIIGLTKPSRGKQDASEPNNLEFLSESFDQPMKADVHRLNDSTSSRQSSYSDGSKGLLKLVKSHSSLRQKIFRSRSQSCMNLQHNDSRQNSPQSPGVWGLNQTQDCDDRFAPTVGLRSNRGNGGESYRPKSQGQLAETLSSNCSQSSSGDVRLVGPKSAGFIQSSSLKKFKFWKRNKLVQNSSDANLKKETLMTKIKQVQILKPNINMNSKNEEKKTPNISNPSPNIKTCPSLLHINLKDSFSTSGQRPKQSDVEITISARNFSNSSSSGWTNHQETLLASPIINESEGHKLPPFGDGIPRGYIEKNISMNLPKPTRPPRKIPVTMKTL